MLAHIKNVQSANQLNLILINRDTTSATPAAPLTTPPEPIVNPKPKRKPRPRKPRASRAKIPPGGFYPPMVEPVRERGVKPGVRYNSTFYHSIALAYWALKFYQKLPSDVTVLYSRGASGCSIASAIALYAGCSGRILIHLNFRKSASAHSPVGGLDNHVDVDGVGCIVDDFISTGTTLAAIYKEAAKFSDVMPTPKYAMVGHTFADDRTELSDRGVPKKLKIITVEPEE